jgi:hypothetical protein
MLKTINSLVDVPWFACGKPDSPVESCGSKLRKACEGTRTSKDTISDHLIVMLELVNIPHFSRLSNAVVVTIKLGLG